MRERVVTRTIKVVKVTALFMDLDKVEPYNETYILSNHFKNEKKMIEHLEKLEIASKQNDNIKCVAIVDKENNEKLYKMAEERFIQLAEEVNAE